ncbi:MAG: sulfatase-like hydrolase/transferase [Puniceicoccaceae bacterium]|nr:sulfatase-like hydrolase/transferase [Puniceicoccaceae bacterium]
MKIQTRPSKHLLSAAFAVLISALPLHGDKMPNVVFILIDDISHYGVSAYGAKQLNSTEGFFESVPVATPAIDRLADEGVLAGNAFAYPVCEPTRVALMTGMNNQRNFVQAKALHESHITFGDLFKQAGYITGIAGKWKQSRGTASIPGEAYVDQFGWDEIHCFDLLYEGPRHIDPNFVINGKINWYKGLNPETQRRYYGPERVNRFALDFIEAHQDEPFFLYYPMLLVHDEHTPTPDTQPNEHYDNFEVMTHTGVKPDNSFGAFKGDDRRFYPDMVAYMDKMIGKVTDQLDRLGLRKKTIIVVMGDNGSKAAFSYTLQDGSEFIGAKGQCKVNGLQVPLILSYPDSIASGTRYNGLINVTDLLPTLCDAAGIEIQNKEDLDGISFWPQVTGTHNKPHREQLYTWYNANRAMTDQTKLITYAQEIGFKRYGPDTNYPQGRFFDLRSDPFEREGVRKVKFDWNNWHHSGLDISRLTEAQRAAYDRLGAVLVKNAYCPVSDVKIVTSTTRLKVNESIRLQKLILPKDATMRSVIWESSDPAIAMVDKFGIVTARQPGEVIISLYSWDDERPVADGKKATLSKTGLSDQITLRVTR